MTTIVLTPETLAAMLRGELARKRDAWKQTRFAPEIEAYMEWRRARGHNEKAMANCEYVLSTMALYFCDRELSDLSGKQGRRMLVEYLNRAYPHDRVNETTRGNYITHLRGFFKWAYLEELIERNPTDGLDKPRPKERRYVLLTDEELQRLFTMQPSLRDRAALRLAYDCALRRGDLRSLRCGSIDPFAGTVDLLDGKNGTVRTLPIREKETRLELQRHFAERKPDPDEYLLYPWKVVWEGGYFDPDRSQRVVWEDRFKPLADSAISGTMTKDGRPVSWWDRCCANAKITRKPGEKRLHDLRHKRLTDLDNQGIEHKAISVFARHSNQATTDLYIHRMNQTEWLRRKLG